MKDHSRLVMIVVLALAGAAVVADHIRHRPPYSTQAGMDSISEEAEAPCSMGLGHAEEDEEEEL